MTDDEVALELAGERDPGPATRSSLVVRPCAGMLRNAMRAYAHFLVLSVSMSLAACGSTSAIEDQPNGEIDKSSASWEETGAVPDQPLDAGGVTTDAGPADAGAPLDAASDAGDPDAGDPNADSGQSDAATDAA